jgi:hypothetical protein
MFKKYAIVVHAAIALKTCVVVSIERRLFYIFCKMLGDFYMYKRNPGL